jgi:hypothetical protein
MTSSKTKEQRRKESSLRRAKLLSGIDTRDTSIASPPGSVPADHHELRHNNTYDRDRRIRLTRVQPCGVGPVIEENCVSSRAGNLDGLCKMKVPDA